MRDNINWDMYLLVIIAGVGGGLFSCAVSTTCEFSGFDFFVPGMIIAGFIGLVLLMAKYLPIPRKKAGWAFRPPVRRE